MASWRNSLLGGTRGDPLGEHRVGRKAGKIKNKGFVWEPYGRGGLNQDIEITVRIPAYLVAGLMKESRRGPLDWVVREAVKEYLVKRGQTWWQPRFLTISKAEQIEANERFTSQSQ